MGVEPTKERLTPLTGFEARPLHQERVSSMIRLTPVGRGWRLARQRAAAHAMFVAHPAQIADTVEKLQDLYRALAPDADPVAEHRGKHLALFRRQSRGNSGQLGHRGLAIEQIALD